jgi:hypothetical protein
MGSDLRREDRPKSGPGSLVLDGEEHKLIPIDQTVIAAQQKKADAFTKLGRIPQLDASHEFDSRYNQIFFEENK